jgi:uncharacterized protein (TIGR02145 family)
MKNIFLSVLCIALFSINTEAQIKTMIITKNDGTVIKIPNDSISNITFSPELFYEPVFGTMTDSRDGKTYETVRLNNQVWMAQNLDYDVPGVYTNSTGSVVDTANPAAPVCGKYGRLYDWSTLMNGDNSSASNPSNVQGICPNGWHLPSDAEWKELEMNLGMSSTEANNTYWRGTDQGTQMRSTADWYFNGTGTNSSGFNVLPAGSYDGMFTSITYGSTFWSSTTDPANAGTSWGRYLEWGISTVERLAYANHNGCSCRCVQD